MPVLRTCAGTNLRASKAQHNSFDRHPNDGDSKASTTALLHAAGRTLLRTRPQILPSISSHIRAKLSTAPAETMIDLTQDSPPQKKRRTEATPSGALVHTLARTHNVQEHTIGAVRRLLVDEQRTVPFVARYRAQETQHLPPDALRAILDALHGAAALEAKRQKVLEAMQTANASPEALSAARRAGTLRGAGRRLRALQGPGQVLQGGEGARGLPCASRRPQGRGPAKRPDRRITISKGRGAAAPPPEAEGMRTAGARRRRRQGPARAGRDAAPVYQGHGRGQEGQRAERGVPLLRGLVETVETGRGPRVARARKSLEGQSFVHQYRPGRRR